MRAASAETGYRHLEALAHRLLGDALLPTDTAAASDHIGHAVETLRQSGARNHLARALVSAAALRRRLGDVEAARAALEESLAIFEEVGTLDEPGRVRRALALLDAETLPGGQVDHP